MSEILKKVSGGVLRVFSSTGSILGVCVIGPDPFQSVSDSVSVMKPLTLTINRDGTACYGLIQLSDGKLTPRLRCGYEDDKEALIHLPTLEVLKGDSFVVPGITFTADQSEFNRQLGDVIGRAVKPKLAANVLVIRAADKAATNAR